MSLVEVKEAKPGIYTLTLNDPDKLNAMSSEMADEFSMAVGALREEQSKIRAVILTGAGRAFSAGGDLNMLLKKRELSGEENRRRMLHFYYSFLSILSLDVPLIAAINGHAIGAGLCLACACDIRVVAKGAKLGFTFTKLGLHPGMGATYFVPKVLGNAAARDLLLTSRIVKDEEVVSLGLASELVETDQVVETAFRRAEEISSCGPEATRQLLQSLRIESAPLETILEREALCQSINYASEDFLEGVSSVKEKRPANFPGASK